MYGGYDRGLGLAFELLGGTLIVGTIGKRGKNACHRAGLRGVLEIERKMETFAKKCNSSGI